MGPMFCPLNTKIFTFLTKFKEGIQHNLFVSELFSCEDRNRIFSQAGKKEIILSNLIR